MPAAQLQAHVGNIHRLLVVEEPGMWMGIGGIEYDVEISTEQDEVYTSCPLRFCYDVSCSFLSFRYVFLFDSCFPSSSCTFACLHLSLSVFFFSCCFLFSALAYFRCCFVLNGCRAWKGFSFVAFCLFGVMFVRVLLLHWFRWFMVTSKKRVEKNILCMCWRWQWPWW